MPESTGPVSPAPALQMAGPFNGSRLALLLQWLADDAYSGWMQIGADAEIGFSRGAAVVARWGALVGREAILELYHVQRGSFHLRAGPPPEGKPIGSPSALSLVGFTAADHWRLLAPSVYRLTRELASGEQPESLRRMLALLDGHRTLCEARREAGLSRSLVVNGVWELARGGALTEVAEPRPDGVETLVLQDVASGDTALVAALKEELRTSSARHAEERARTQAALRYVARLERALLRVHTDTTAALAAALEPVALEPVASVPPSR